MYLLRLPASQPQLYAAFPAQAPAQFPTTHYLARPPTHPPTHPPQARLAQLKLVSELYVYRVVDADLIFHVLNTCLLFGYQNPAFAERVDPAYDFFRVRMVATVVDTVGPYFTAPRHRARLNLFMLQLQKYLQVGVEGGGEGIWGGLG